MKVALPILLSDEERQTLTSWSRGRSTPARLVLRAKIILAAAAGVRNKDIAQQCGTSKPTVARWRTRFAKLRLAGIERDASRPGRTPAISRKVVEEILRKTTQEKPSGATHWSTRTMAQEVGVSKATVQRVWSAHNLKPHLHKTFKVSNDPQFAEKLWDVVGLYLNPPEHALVLSCDEKSQIQALDRTQKSLPMVPGRCGTLTHDYMRHGTTTLFAALNVAEGIVIGECMPRHRHQEWIKFLKRIDAATDPSLDLHLIVDNYATHKHSKVRRWLARHSRFHMHFTPTSSSWMNLVERWFRDLTDKRLRRGTFRSVPQLIQAIEDYIDHHNNTGKGFQWTAKAEVILEKVRRARATLDKTHSV
ncbi:IS630 family transposase [Telmatocola sphagniphila]|uniref:IS630 family transposase n=1 Tax=Telmatocola sphagniphila TaxID=1123043 RepID=A0A8E6EUG0_9BACT|nr:IS630 family transposase [Telmatocola sphagniphila]QVL31345.1 IS630 family transposase [Telmatocola sphagniphila]